ncbi:MAG: hypothetical protein JO194_08365 [Candidatus Eremiobacteraeota bacterium]|nr:hypothetical protein [Candidatus Eremiobacteraeota bacterium]
MKRFNLIAIALAALAAPLVIVLSAKADLAQLNDGAPVINIKSTGGRIYVHPGEPDGMVRIPGNPNGVQMNRFNVDPQTMSTFCFPRPQALVGTRRGFRPAGTPANTSAAGCTQHKLPLREGPHGVAINNPGSDVEVGVPNRFELMHIEAGASPVVIERTRGPFFITGQNDVTLRNVSGQGAVLTEGNIDARNMAGSFVGGSANGRLALVSNAALDRSQLYARFGEIDWTIEGLGGGPYRVQTDAAGARIFIRPGVGANIDATSDGGTVTNSLDPATTSVGFAGPHAVSMTVNGGGAQVTIHSKSGNIIIAPAP